MLMRKTTMRWHDDDDHPADATERRLKELARAEKEAELARQLETKARQQGTGDG
jgi:hypothetical protein